MDKHNGIRPFPNCPALNGCHCQTNSLAKLYHYHGYPLSEEMLFGLGAGLGFFYWHQKGAPPFVGGRGNVKNFFTDVGRRTGVGLEVKTTASAQRAEEALLEKLARLEPVMLFGDMAYLPWFDFPADYHFGGHTFTVCGWDGAGTVLASDMDAQAGGLKKGFYHPISLEQLRRARNSPYKPFPPKNAWVETNFDAFCRPAAADLREGVAQTAAAMLNPPISNAGVKGISRTAMEIGKWPNLFDERELRLNLFNLYVFIEIGGTGGGCFRPMYARFLREASGITGDKAWMEASVLLERSGELFTGTGLLFKEAMTMSDIEVRLAKAAALLQEIAGIEEEAFGRLAGIDN